VPLEPFLAIHKALCDSTRVRALLALRDGELCLCQLIGLLDLAPSTLSQHMQVLHAAGLVERRKEGRWQWFRIAGPDAPPAVRRAIDAACEELSTDPGIERDRRRLRTLARLDPVELTACYRT